MNENYRQLDELYCLMYIPKDAIFKSSIKHIAGSDAIDLFDSISKESMKARHPGGNVFFIRDSGSTHGRFPFLFLAPSIVTIDENDIKELSIDLNVLSTLKSANWPGIEQIEKWYHLSINFIIILN